MHASILHVNVAALFAGVENVSDHGTIGPRKYFKFQRQKKKSLLTRHKCKFLIGRKYIEFENDQN